MASTSVKAYQQLLNQYGYNLKVDGIRGPKTTAAIRDFQAKHGLVKDGIVGPKTLAALKGGSTNTLGGQAPPPPPAPVAFAPNDAKTVADVAKEWELAAKIRQDPQHYRNLFGHYGMQFNDDISRKLYSNAEGSGDLWKQINDMQELAAFADVHKQYDAAPFSLDTARKYRQDFGTAESATKYFKARDYFKSPEGLESLDTLRTFMGKGYSPDEVLNFYKPGQSEVPFEQQLEQARKRRDALSRETQTQNAYQMGEEGPTLQGRKKVYI